MGCDIHAYLDYTYAEPNEHSTGSYCTFAGNIDIDRNYTLFGLLAGVRRGNVVFEPRGVPSIDVLGHQTRRDYWERVEHIGPEKAKAYSPRAEVSYGEVFVPKPDWHSPSWLYQHELELVIEAYPDSKTYIEGIRAVAAAMKVLNGRKRKRSRLVFWFDN